MTCRHAVAAAVFAMAFLPLNARADDARSTVLQNARSDMIALEAALRHLRESVAGMDQQSQSDIALLTEKVGWWQDCYSGKIDGCWEWLNSSKQP